MGTDDGTVDDQVFHIWVISEMDMHILPNVMVTPACKSLIDAVPRPIFLWQKPPLGTSAVDPKHGFNKTPAVGAFADIDTRMRAQKGEYFEPLRI